MIKALNQALRSQRNYITCTKDYTITRKPHRPVSLLVKNFKPASSCQRDNNGPHDFKACVDGYVCYMYHWNDRGNQISWHIERPFGRAILEEQDWDIDIKDIITSSVRGHLLGTSENAHTILQEITAASDPTFSLTSIKKALDPSTPGLFNIPVCISDHNWATVVDGHHPPGKWVHNLDMTNTIKSLPCNCGLWGNDTKRVWQDLALWSPNKNFKSMTCINCNWQIFYRIKEPLEMYVAACRLEFKLPQLAFPFAKAGKHSECDTITRLIDASGSTPKQFTENYPEIYRALVCWLRIVPGHRSKFCSKYQQLTMPQLLDLAEQDMKDNRQYQKDFSERLKKWGKGKQVAGVETLDPLSLLDFAETNIMTMVPRTPKDDRQWEVLMEDFAQMRDELMIWESQANSNATLIEGHYPE